MDDKQMLYDLLKFHGHYCWAGVGGLRMGLTALRILDVKRSGAKSLHAIIETGYNHSAGCFADGIQYATGCTLGKGNIERNPKGKLAVTLIDKKRNKAVRIAYRPIPVLMEKIVNAPFTRKRGLGIPPDQIPTEEQEEVVNIMWDAGEQDIMIIGPVTDHEWQEEEEITRLVICAGCGELVAESYMRVVNGKPVCMDCSGYSV